MRIRSIIVALAAAALLLACAREPETPEYPGGELVQVSFSASMQSTRVMLNGFELYWQEGDRVAVYDGIEVREFVLTEGAGTRNGRFSGSVSASASKFAAVYPYSAAVLSGSSLKGVVPAEQTASSGSVDPSALVMRAEFSKGQVMQFAHCASLLRFSVPKGASQLMVCADDGSAIAGESSTSVSISLPGTSSSNFEVAVNPGEYKGISAFVRSGDSYLMKTSANTLKATVGCIVSIGHIDPSDAAVPIRNAAEMTAFLGSCSGSSDPSAILLADIDMAGSGYASAKDYSGTLMGRGMTVSGISKPLFAQLHGTVKDLFTSDAVSTSATEFATVALQNYGTLSGVSNGALVSVGLSGAITGPLVVGGIAAYNYGTMTDCANTGAVSVNCTGSIEGAAVGGLAGYSEGPVTGGTNSAEISLSAQFGSKYGAIGKISSSGASLGGIVGAAWDGNGIEGSTNNGAVTFTFSAIEKGAAYPRSQIGGIIGSSYGNVESSHNHGAISVSGVTSNRSVESTLNYIFDVGGISGGAAYQDGNKDKTDIVSCSNDAPVNVLIDASKSNSPVGGIVGWPGAEATGLVNCVSSCTNSGAITMDGAGKVRLGGIMGGTGHMENCSNSGMVHVKNAYYDSTIGGVIGFHSRDHKLRACSNTGDVVSDVDIWGAGGLIGCHGAVNITCAEVCSVDCAVSNAAAGRGGTGIVLGVYNKNTTTSITLGTVEEPIDVKGSVSWGGTGVEINQATYKFYLSGTDYASDTHVINAVCSVPAPADDHYAEGYVTWSTGGVVSGVSVSDGFHVAVTDDKGYYKLSTTDDTCYIYISFPSDAEITRKSDGRPDFFVKYVYPQTRYDFSLKRQAVESEFLLFALGDPQAHYSARSGQNIADTERFRQESVPAMNAHISEQSLPCYGVTLGDIVYSEGSRNSNPGLSKMVSHFSNLNMPVFQTMGNHDYTYFYTSKKLTTDSSSSTLYLKAQRSFEDAFGPVNLSFNRGDVHIICMRNIIYDSDIDAASYHCGYTAEQLQWLKEDLSNVPKTKMVILCGHIPLISNSSGDNVSAVLNLLKQYKLAKVFSGHTHYKRYTSSTASSGIAEHIHGAVCGCWWWSNLQGDGCPNGYYVYRINGTSIKDEYFMGINNKMNTRDYQMRVYRGNIKTGGPNAYFQLQHDPKVLLINVFNGDSRWSVKVYENGSLSGIATALGNSRKTWNSVTAGTTYDVPTSSSQDWWAIGYHIGVRGRGMSNTSYYTSMFHMYKYTLKDVSSSVRVEATDGYGNKYSTTEVIETDLYYPDYMKQGNVD